MPRIHVLIRIAVCFLFVFLPLQPMDEWFYDRFFRVRGFQGRPTDVVLVRVNSANLKQIVDPEGGFYPHLEPDGVGRANTVWYRSFYGRLVSAIEASQPRLVVFTSFFDRVDEERAPKLGFKNLLFSAYLDEENKLVPPTAYLTDGENYGFSNIFPDSDNIVRRAHLIYSSGTSLSVRAFRFLYNDPIHRDLVAPLNIDFRGPPGSFPLYDAREVIDGQIDPHAFDGKIVMIGREGSRYSEYDTPVGLMTKLELQANILENFIRGSELRIIPRLGNLALTVVVILISIAIILYFPPALAWLLLLLQALLIILFSLLLFSFPKVWVGISNPIFGIFGTHLLLLGYKLTRQEEQQWRIQQEADYLKEVDQFKNNFISLFSHDLKTPIAKIKAITNRLLAQHPDLKPEVKGSLKTLDQTNNELARLISDILKVTKMESMRIEPVKEVIDINRLVEQAVARLLFLAEEKNLEIVQDLEPLFSMEGDPHLIGEVITNLVENAIKYSPPEKKIVIRTSEEEDRVRVSVVDQGDGIPADELPRVTSKFYRGRTAAQQTKGSGLGLYLSKYFVELHRGQLDLQSELGKGTQVSFWLPIVD